MIEKFYLGVLREMPGLKDKKLEVFANLYGAWLRYGTWLRYDTSFVLFWLLWCNFLSICDFSRLKTLKNLGVFNFKTRQILKDFIIPRKKVSKYVRNFLTCYSTYHSNTHHHHPHPLTHHLLSSTPLQASFLVQFRRECGFCSIP